MLNIQDHHFRWTILSSSLSSSSLFFFIFSVNCACYILGKIYHRFLLHFIFLPLSHYCYCIYQTLRLPRKLPQLHLSGLKWVRDFFFCEQCVTKTTRVVSPWLQPHSEQPFAPLCHEDQGLVDVPVKFLHMFVAFNHFIKGLFKHDKKTLPCCWQPHDVSQPSSLWVALHEESETTATLKKRERERDDEEEEVLAPSSGEKRALWPHGVIGGVQHDTSLALKSN